MLIEERIPAEAALNKAIGYLVTKQIELLKTIEQWKSNTNYWQQRCEKAEAELNEVKARLAELETKDDIDLAEGDTECTTA